MLQNFFFFVTDTNGNPTRPKFSSKAKKKKIIIIKKKSKAKSQPWFSKIQAAHLTTNTNLQRQGMDYGRKKYDKVAPAVVFKRDLKRKLIRRKINCQDASEVSNFR